MEHVVATSMGWRTIGVCAVWAAIGACLPPSASRAQDGSELNTDRDAFTPSVFCVADGRFLAESSYVFIDNREGLPTNSYPELLCRHGVSDRLELRFGVNYDVNAQGNVVTSVEAGEVEEPGRSEHESSLLYGLKAAVSDQDGLIPQSCFIMEGDTPVQAKHYGSSPIATIVAGWELPFAFPTRESRPWRLDTSLRYSYVEGKEEWFSRWGPSAVLRMPVTQRFETHLEWFGTFSDGLHRETSRPFFSPGCHVVITRRFEIGLRVGWGLTQDAAPFFSDVGCGWRY